MATLSKMKSIEQARAKFAWGCANKSGNKDSKEYSSAVNKVPAYIKTNGLLNTIAFLYSKSSGKNGEVLESIRLWLINTECGLIPDNKGSNNEKFD